MFKRLTIAALVLFAALMVKADEGQKVTSKVQKVTVFLNGAQVTRTAIVNIVAGTTDLIFENISPDIDPQSIQVHANGEFTILSVKHEMNYLSSTSNKTQQLLDLHTKQKSINDKITMLNNMLAIYQAEETVIAKNQSVKAENATLDVVKLKQALDFQTERLTMLKQKEQDAGNQITVLYTERQQFDNQINEINNGQTTATSNIIVAVSSKAALQSTFAVSYLTADASWYASYDIRAKNVNTPLTIAYKANVLQHSGEDWKNVKLTLSTGLPSNNAIKPELMPYYLNVYNDVERALRGRVAGVAMNNAGDKESNQLAEVVVANGNAKSIPVSVDMQEAQTSVEFNIDNPYSVTNDGKPCQVEINNINVNASYQYYAAPKISTDVFLTASVTDLNKYNLLSGDANVFFEGTYIGKSRIDMRAMSDTLNLSLGNDKGILIKRTLEKNLTQNQTFGSNKKETKSWSIEVKNRKSQKIGLLVEDQVPVSQNSAIEVEVQETSGAKPDATTGKVSWNLTLNSQDDKKLQLKYMVKYPKSQSVIVQ
ncbi:DUF4139 domain-containing protein [Mucilaginibacter sp. L3T2-6]|uniref:DUF4139 domain-containing protein n=1 Tax=Mucilaginibacter sp. L3T2-6 TaxID=3062491 RepID=UPI002676762A|nr:DUF4139 domain-containing protein [Mucilaginibacter sp. L3T2-6]MDO3644523.1 DUF4139 domain-containing protein [Mucilaginibacter sp. L3T2-6]MDV6216975.1 DUF4139 domain-containing protein [Mucilaginibacter sp. L3T2-6]